MGGLLASWATTADLCSPCSPTLVVDEAAFEASIRKASEVLYNFTRQKWPGVGTDIFRPCSTTCSGGRWLGDRPDPLGGQLYDRAQCGCGWQDRIILPGFPVVSITEVLVDGAVMSPTSYRLDNDRELVTVRPTASAALPLFPVCQRMDLPTTQPNTWQVTYQYGIAPPPAGVSAAAALGCELALACQPDGSAEAKACRLPKRVQTVVRQNVTMAVLDPLTLFANGQTGLADVDLWVGSVLYGDKWRPAAVYDANTFRSRTRR